MYNAVHSHQLIGVVILQLEWVIIDNPLIPKLKLQLTALQINGLRLEMPLETLSNRVSGNDASVTH